MFNSLLIFLQNSHTSIFWASAIAGTTLFGLRVIMAFLGGDLVGHGDADHIDFDHAHDHEPASLKLFTLHSLSGFFMMFGWAGLAATVQYGLSPMNALFIATVVGVATMLLVAAILRAALLLEDGGAVFSIDKTVGLVGTVYQDIPAHGQGKVSIVTNGITRELLAQSADKRPIASFCLVKIVKVIDYEIVEVIQL